MGSAPPGAPSDADWVTTRRLRGYAAAMAAHGLRLDPRDVVAGPATIEGGTAALRRAWDAGRRPTGVLAMSDAMAIGVLGAARELGLRVPGDLSVVGYDDVDTSRHTDPPLTTVHQPIREKGERAVGLLLAIVDGRHAAASRPRSGSRRGSSSGAPRARSRGEARVTAAGPSTPSTTTAPGATSSRSGARPTASSTGATRSGCGSARGTTPPWTGSWCGPHPMASRRSRSSSRSPAGPAARWWEATIRLSMPVTGYRFLVLGAAGPRWLNGSGIHSAAPTDHDDFRIVAGYRSPSWLRDTVFYQVFPDRFANGDPSNDVVDGAWTYRGEPARRGRWGDPPGAWPGAMVEFFGGDLAGIEQRLDHLERLGVNGLYLTPVFETRSSHGYDTIDYTRVADHFGGDAALASLRRATSGARDPAGPRHHAQPHRHRAPVVRRRAGGSRRPRPPAGTRSTGGPTTTSRGSASRRCPSWTTATRASARRCTTGPTRSCADGCASRSPSTAGGSTSPTCSAGWGRSSWVRRCARGIRAAVKAENPDAYLLGEHFFDASETLNGDEWDGVMNYAGFASPVHHWLADELVVVAHGTGEVARLPRTSTPDLVRTLTAFRAAAPWALARNQYDLLGSHDTARIRTVLGRDPGRLRAAFGLLLTEVGVPGLFYGDEIGLEGVDGSAARVTMPWDERTWDGEQLAFVRDLVRFRRASRALRTGGLQALEQRDESYAFLRDTDDEQVVVVAVRGPAARPDEPLRVDHGAIPDGTRLASVLTGQEAVVEGGHLRIGSTPPGVAVWVTSA